MDRSEFLDAIQQRAKVDSRDEARIIAHATLSTLSQRINKNEAENIASHLPEPLADTLVSENKTIEEFSADEFSERVRQRQIEEEYFNNPTTERHVRAVMEVISIAIPENVENELDEVRNQLPTDFESLFKPVSNDTQYSDDLSS